MKLTHVSRSMTTDGSRRADQHAVWADIAKKSSRLGSCSDTEAAAAMYEERHAALDEFVRCLTPVADQVGAIFAMNGVVVGLEAFDSPRAWHNSVPKLARSYGLDLLDETEWVFPRTFREPQDFIDAVIGADTKASAALGMGTDIRFDGSGIVGGALLVDSTLVHVVAFPAGA
jgi:hypothetical protein